MTIEEFIRTIAPRIGPNSTFDLMRDAQLKAFSNLLIEKNIASKSEIDAEIEKALGETAKNITNMPPLPNDTDSKNGNKKPNSD